MRLRRPTTLAALCAVALTVAAGADEARAAYEIARPLGAAVPVYAVPDGSVRTLLSRTSPASGEPRGYLVIDERWIAMERWLRVRLGTRPNTASGWVLAADVETERASSEVEISLRRRTLAVRRSGRIVLRARIVIGKPSTPTPTGTFAVWDETPAPASVYAPWVASLTAHSTVLRTFDGGEARVAIHGMNGPLAVAPGSAASNGCIRVPPAVMARVAALVQIGTPVTIAP